MSLPTNATRTRIVEKGMQPLQWSSKVRQSNCDNRVAIDKQRSTTNIWKVWKHMAASEVKTAANIENNSSPEKASKLRRVFCSHIQHRRSMKIRNFFSIFTIVCESIKRHAMPQFVRAEDSEWNKQKSEWKKKRMKREINQTEKYLQRNGKSVCDVWQKNSETACTTSTHTRAPARPHTNRVVQNNRRQPQQLYVFCVRLYRRQRRQNNSNGTAATRGQYQRWIRLDLTRSLYLVGTLHANTRE